MTLREQIDTIFESNVLDVDQMNLDFKSKWINRFGDKSVGNGKYVKAKNKNNAMLIFKAIKEIDQRVLYSDIVRIVFSKIKDLWGVGDYPDELEINNNTITFKYDMYISNLKDNLKKLPFPKIRKKLKKLFDNTLERARDAAIDEHGDNLSEEELDHLTKIYYNDILTGHMGDEQFTYTCSGEFIIKILSDTKVAITYKLILHEPNTNTTDEFTKDHLFIYSSDRDMFQSLFSDMVGDLGL